MGSRRAAGDSAAGSLVYVMGPSGAGKDTVLRLARSHLGSRVRIARRTITRPPDRFEDNREVSTEVFEREQAGGRFALWWEANGLRYGIDREIDAWLADGAIVIVNGSRAHLRSANRRYGATLRPVLITARPEVLRARLAERDREPATGRSARLERSVVLGRPDHDRLAVIDNSDDIADAVQALIDFINGLEAAPS